MHTWFGRQKDDVFLESFLFWNIPLEFSLPSYIIHKLFLWNWMSFGKKDMTLHRDFLTWDTNLPVNIRPEQKFPVGTSNWFGMSSKGFVMTWLFLIKESKDDGKHSCIQMECHFTFSLGRT